MSRQNRAQYAANLIELARAAFERHEIRHESAGRWMLYRREPGGSYSANHCAEVAALGWGTLVVHGDVETVAFAGGSYSEPLELVRWIGEHHATDYRYLAEKARRGMGLALECVDDAVARDDLHTEIATLRGCGATREALLPYGAALRALDSGDGVELVRHELWRETAGDVDTEWLATFGRVADPRLFYAHAACARLCALLEARGAL